MSERAREPLFFEGEEGAEPEPETSSAGGVRPPGRIGSGLSGDSADREKWRSAPIEDLSLSMRAYSRFRRSGLMLVGDILARTEDELMASLKQESGQTWGHVLMTIEISGSRVDDVDLSGADPVDLAKRSREERARRDYEELRHRLDELGVVPRDTDWDTARGVN